MTMTDHTDVAERAEIDLGHPVRGFVLVMAGLAIALLVLQWSGLVLPRVVSVSSASSSNPGSAITRQQLLRNDGPFTVEVTALSWPVTGARSTVNAAPFTLEPGEERLIIVRIDAACGTAHLGPLVVEARPPIGLHRAVEIERSSEEIVC